MYKVKGTALIKGDEGKFEQDFETLEEAEKFVRKMAIDYGVKADILEIRQCGKYIFAYINKRKEIMQILDQYGVQYEVDKDLNIKIEF